MLRSTLHHRSQRDVALSTMLAVALTWSGSTSAADYPVTPPEFSISLTAAEYSLLVTAAQRGVTRYGGDAGWDTTLRRSGNDSTWQVTLRSERLIDVWTYWLNEQGADLLSTLDLEARDEGQQEAVKTFQSVRGKLADARSTPHWPVTRLRGRLEVTADAASLVTASGRIGLVCNDMKSVTSLDGQDVRCAGIVRRPNELDVTLLAPIAPAQVDVVVMSLCPFARRAEKNLLDQLGTSGSASDAVLGFHYLFYRDAMSGALTSLHGEPEIVENLVQMTIREFMPEHLVGYLRLRAERDDPWEQLAAAAGLDAAQIEFVRGYSTANRDSMMNAEFLRVSGLLGVTDGSPTIFWNGDRVRSIGAIPIFSQPAVAEEGACNQNLPSTSS